MTITLNVQNEQLFDKVLWLLNHLKNDGLEILINRSKVKSHDFISRMTQNPRRISTDTKFLSRDEANELIYMKRKS